MAAKVKTAPKARKRATGPSKAQELPPAEVAESGPTEKPLPVVVQGATGLNVPEVIIPFGTEALFRAQVQYSGRWDYSD